MPPRDGGQKPIKTGSQKSASSAVNSYGVDTNWYFDSGSTDHITNSLEQLSTRERYNGQEQIHAANGKGMSINHIGNTTFHTPNRDFSFHNVLHVPVAIKNLISVHQFTSDNDVFLEFHPSFFYVKDLATKTPLLHGRCQDGLYPLPRLSEVHHVTTPTSSQWHHRLGHASPPIVSHVLRDHSLSLKKIPMSQFVMLVNKQRVINFLTLRQIVFLLFLYNWCFQMFGVLHQSQLVGINTM